MTVLWGVFALGFIVFLIKAFPAAYYRHKRDLRRQKQAEMYRRIQLVMPGLVDKFKEVTFAFEQGNVAMERFAATFSDAWAEEQESRK